MYMYMYVLFVLKACTYTACACTIYMYCMCMYYIHDIVHVHRLPGTLFHIQRMVWGSLLQLILRIQVYTHVCTCMKTQHDVFGLDLFYLIDCHLFVSTIFVNKRIYMYMYVIHTCMLMYIHVHVHVCVCYIQGYSQNKY